ncbi:MAG TPA: hypothetical protein PL041_06605 [Melioribacteraceae bacterium]|nr:hypothetical protein [Melioribacteraceae bacterium]
METKVKTPREKTNLFRNIKQRMIEFCDKLDKSILDNPECRDKMIIGPVSSRRFGNILVINNVLCKSCTYNCIYCQTGGADCCRTERDSCFNPYELFFYIRKKIEEAEKSNIKINYIAFRPRGEATLDLNLAQEIRLIRELGYKTIVFTNSSLIWNDNVKENLSFSDLVSLKVDTVNETIWNKLNRPHKRLPFDAILENIVSFSKKYYGKLTTETMIVKDINDDLGELKKTCDYLGSFRRDLSYFFIPQRPPLKDTVLAPDMKKLEEIKLFVPNNLEKVKMICCDDSGNIELSGDFEGELLKIISVKSLKESEVESIILKYNLKADLINNWLKNDLIIKKVYNNNTFITVK